MTTCSAQTHPDHAHQHGTGCGHPAVRHSGHIDYLHVVTSIIRTKAMSMNT